jgi:hypothetical protein
VTEKRDGIHMSGIMACQAERFAREAVELIAPEL